MTEHGAAAVLALLALLGLLNSVYFALLYFRVVSPDHSSLPSFCRIGENTCQSVVFTRDGSLLGFPNSLLGIAYYLLLMGVAASRVVAGRYMLLDLALAASAGAVLMGVYLIWALLVKLKQPCPL